MSTQHDPPTGPTAVVHVRHSRSGPGGTAVNRFATGPEAVEHVAVWCPEPGWRYRPCDDPGDTP